ncbi:hypothetical protein Tfer_2378 [Thermincola ferriacetica]|uniref:DUF58 domain-containing protein n=1 Tax=Thermincola ferriacetica TaxID=281456 RepID=A0A0L6W0M5_9FIRM|nr:DUF58 domain-containing protein [Thermincola ferriacetica]KNZ69016.1 hypothetical protein Tfer_2378 [Thermincola ferriacetica]
MKLSGVAKGLLWLIMAYIYAGLVGGRLPYFILYASIGVLAVSLVWVKVLAGVKIKATLDTNRSEVGKVIFIKLKVENTSFLPLPWVHCSMELPDAFGPENREASFGFHLKSYEKKEFQIPLECSLRGFFQWGRMTVQAGDIFGLFYSSKVIENRLNLLIRPRADFLGKSCLRCIDAREGDRVWSVRPGRHVSEFRGVRAYNPGDSLNRIHWKASLKAQRFLVKEYEQSMMNEMLIFVDLASPKHTFKGYDNSFERGLHVAASLAATAIREGLNVGMVLCSDSLLAIPPNRSKGHLSLILDFLARASRGTVPNAFTEALIKEGLYHPLGDMLILITPDLEAGLVQTLSMFTGKGYKVFVALLKLETFEDGDIDIQARDLAVSRIRHMGIQVLLVDKDTSLQILFGGVQHAAG